MSLSLGGSRALVCHGAKRITVTFGWCGTDGYIQGYLASVGMEGQLLHFFLFFPQSILNRQFAVRATASFGTGGKRFAFA